MLRKNKRNPKFFCFIHITMYNKKQILSKKKQKPKVGGVYFLIYEDEIIYIGKTKNIYERIYHHKIQFDFFTIIKCEELNLNELERQYIMKFEPKYNKHYLSYFQIERAKLRSRMNKELKLNAKHCNLL